MSAEKTSLLRYFFFRANTLYCLGNHLSGKFTLLNNFKFSKKFKIKI